MVDQPGSNWALGFDDLDTQRILYGLILSRGTSLMVEDEIAEVGIDHDGRLYVRPTGHSFPYIYRAAKEVSWDPYAESYSALNRVNGLIEIGSAKFYRRCPMNMAFASKLVPELFGQMFPMSFGSKLKQTKLRCRDRGSGRATGSRFADQSLTVTRPRPEWWEL